MILITTTATTIDDIDDDDDGGGCDGGGCGGWLPTVLIFVREHVIFVLVHDGYSYCNIKLFINFSIYL